MHRPLTLLALAGLCLSVACKKDNPAYCVDNAECAPLSCDFDTNSCVETPDAATADAPPECQMDEECPGQCDETTHSCIDCTGPQDCQGRSDGRFLCDQGDCVECTVSDECPNPTLPICDGGTCRACEADDECDARSGAIGEIAMCNAVGACLDDSDVLFVERAASCPAGNGSSELPFCEITDALAAISGGDTRRVVVVRNGAYASVAISGLDVTLVSRATTGASISSSPATSNRVDVSGAGADVRLIGFEIKGATVTGTYGVRCRSGAACAIAQCDIHGNYRNVFSDGATLRLERSVVRGTSPAGGIVTLNSDFVIVNNLIYDNGQFNMPVGGAQLGTGLGGPREFSFNTVWSNHAQASPATAGGVFCLAATTLSSSIFWDNDGAQALAPCTVEWSVIDNTSLGANNVSGDPLFTVPDPTPGFTNLHIQPGSSAIDGANPAGAPETDHFGQARSDGMPDRGADELGSP